MADFSSVQVYLRIRPLIPEENDNIIIDYKIRNHNDDNDEDDEDDRDHDHDQQQDQQSVLFQVKIPAEKEPEAKLQTKAVRQPNHDVTAAIATTTTATTSTTLTNASPFGSIPTLSRYRDDIWKSYSGFSNIFEETTDTERLYQATVQPLICNKELVTEQNQSVCLFTYGHTGSGKSHTLLGYPHIEDGLYKFAAIDLLKQIQVQSSSSSSPSSPGHQAGANNKTDDVIENENTNENKKCLLLRITELYKDKVVDLLTSQSCFIRESGNKVQIRGPMIEDEWGRINQQPLGTLCVTVHDVVACVENACRSRRVGTSTHHTQSSRSHLVLEMEIITPKLFHQRNLLMTQETQLTRLMWLKDLRNGGHKQQQLPKWTEDYNNNTDKKKNVRQEIKKYQVLVKNTKQVLEHWSSSSSSTSQNKVGGTVVFCDLAGNEYIRDATQSTTREEREESAEINKSLLAVKEMIRSLSSSSNSNSTTQPLTKQQQQQQQQRHPLRHITYRNSKLTMLLKRHLGETQKGRRSTVMLAHISPSQHSLKKTINTLNYSSMVSTTCPTTSRTTY
mmetsp:Transcript_3977/g.4461  ORF Transcript_3977/g.4461 Transcript_3977/m.4461 type:complete len:561 (+) Transcript_3977:145-1827(+)